MEKPRSVGGVSRGSLRLPVGFRFCPTDSELVAYYLKRRACNLPLPASVIPDLDALRFDPSDLPGDSKEKRYFFGNRKWNGNRCDRICRTRSGFWKRLGKPTKIVAPGTNLAIGFKRSRAFYHAHATTTPWIMHEFRLLAPDSNPTSSQDMGDWAVYCILEKSRRCSRRRNGVISEAGLSSGGGGGDVGAVEIRVGEDGSDFGPPQPSSSSSSSSCEITKVSLSSKNGLEEQEESSSSPHGIGCS